MIDAENQMPLVEVEVRTYRLAVVAEEVGLSEQSVLKYVEEGLVTPSESAGAGEALFDDDAIRVLRRIVFLTEVEHVNLAGLRMILSLHREVEALRETVRFYQNQP